MGLRVFGNRKSVNGAGVVGGSGDVSGGQIPTQKKKLV